MDKSFAAFVMLLLALGIHNRANANPENAEASSGNPSQDSQGAPGSAQIKTERPRRQTGASVRRMQQKQDMKQESAYIPPAEKTSQR